MMQARLHLGTANFGAQYGITNPKKLTQTEVNRILEWSVNKLEFLDLSLDYEGATQAVEHLSNKFQISSKVILEGKLQKGEITELINREIRMLGVEGIQLLWVRSQKEFPSNSPQLWLELIELKQQQRIEKIGFSIYDTDEVEKLVEIFPGIDCFQVPENVADRRFSEYVEANPSLRNDFEFVIRSIFLQGLLTMPKNAIPPRLRSIIRFRDKLMHHTETQEQSLTQIVCRYVSQLDWISGVVIGTNTLVQLKETYSYLTEGVDFPFHWLQDLPKLPKEVIDPRTWSSI